MLVVMAIMAIITVILLVNQSRFDSSTVLRSLAYSVALSVRQAQVYGTSVIGTTTASNNCTGGFYASGSCYASAYGIYFNSSTPGTYSIFADLNPGTYTAATIANETVKVFSLGTGYALSSFCALGTNGGSPIERCSPSTISSMVILFKRPNPDASFVALTSGGAPIAGDSYSQAYIQIESGSDATNVKSVSVISTGEVSVCTVAGSC